MNKLNIAVIPGDGIGKEVVPASLKVLNVLAEIDNSIKFNYSIFPWSCDYYLQHGKMMPDDGVEKLQNFDSIFLGAVGHPQYVPDHISLRGLLIKIRRECEQTINVRPAKQIRGIQSPLLNPKDFNFVVVRENSEGEYSEVGGRIHRGDDEIAIQNTVFTKKATQHVMQYAFELAQNRAGYVTSATKSNGIVHSMPFWDEVFLEVSQRYPAIQTSSTHIDALSAFFVTKPEQFDVIVASNLFGDILTKIGAAIMGSIGTAPAANINVSGKYPSMFEPVHGSAPDIYGKGIANPIGQLWAAKMMLDHFGFTELGTLLLDSIEDSTDSGIKTADIGGHSTMDEVIESVIFHLKKRA